MQLSSSFYDPHCYVSEFIHNNQFLANFEMSQNLPFLMNMSLSIIKKKETINDIALFKQDKCCESFHLHYNFQILLNKNMEV